MAKSIASQPFPPRAIAIIGTAGRFPGAHGLDEFWRKIRKGVELLDTFRGAHLELANVPEPMRSNAHYVRKGTVLKECDQFDAIFVDCSPREAQIFDPQQRIRVSSAVVSEHLLNRAKARARMRLHD